VSLPNSLTSIGANAFSHCSSLTTITLPANITTINEACFYACSKLTTVTFKEGSQLTSISLRAFGECTQLTNVIGLPKNVDIDSNAFLRCPWQPESN
jgi:hypothetical protein